MTTRDEPKMLGRGEALRERKAQIYQPHVAALTNFVADLRREAGSGFYIPDFDPWDGGVDAELLFLLEAPGAKARDSGFVSRNNPDETAKNIFVISTEAGIDRAKTALWNTVPWYIGTETNIRPAKLIDIEAGLSPLPRLLALLPRLKAVVLLGKPAERAAVHFADPVRVFKSPHPSPMFINRNKIKNRAAILSVFREVAGLVVQQRDPADVPCATRSDRA